MNGTNNLLVPLTHVALEVDLTADQLADQLGADVLCDDLHRRAIERPLARRLILEHQQRQAARREQEQLRCAAADARAAEAGAAVHAMRRQLKARSAAQAELVASGLPASAVATAADITARAADSSARLDEMLRGSPDQLVYHPVRKG